MSGMFSKPKIPKIPNLATPKPVRLPTEQDPSVLAAAERTREGALRRRGRLSTILSDRTQSLAGSSGSKLGA